MQLTRLVSSILLTMALGAPIAIHAVDAPPPGDPAQQRLAQIDQQRKQLEAKLAEIRARIAKDADVQKALAAAADAAKARELAWNTDPKVKSAREAVAKAATAYDEALKAKLAANPEAGKATTELAALQTEQTRLAAQTRDVTAQLGHIKSALDWVDPELSQAREADEKAATALKAITAPVVKAGKDADAALKTAVEERIKADAKGSEMLTREKDLQAQLQQLHKDLAALRVTVAADPALAQLKGSADAADKAETELKTRPEFIAAADALAKAHKAHEELLARKIGESPIAKPLVEALAKAAEQVAAAKDKQKEHDAKIRAVSAELAKSDADIQAAAKARTAAADAAKALLADADKAIKEAQAAAKTAIEAKLAADPDAKQIAEQLASLRTEAGQLNKKPKAEKAEKAGKGEKTKSDKPAGGKDGEPAVKQ